MHADRLRGVTDGDGLLLSTDLVDRTPLDLQGDGHVDFVIPKLPLFGGNYHLHAAIESSAQCQDWIMDAAEMTVVDGDFYGTGKLYPHDGWRAQGMPVEHHWEIGKAEEK
jgi:lipopolysaccharide transport system ATP-binding protein